MFTIDTAISLSKSVQPDISAHVFFSEFQPLLWIGAKIKIAATPLDRWGEEREFENISLTIDEIRFLREHAFSIPSDDFVTERRKLLGCALRMCIGSFRSVI